MRTEAWTYADAERHLSALEPFGWRFGLERIRLLTSALGLPQHRFASAHVVGTNGKSSVAMMSSALLEAHGTSTGTYLSPHTGRWAERIRLAGQPIDGSSFAAAVQRAAQAAEAVDRTLEEGDAVTQFELLTAAAFVAFAARGVEIGVIEAGLGGRLDATNVIPSRATALTSVGLEHTDLLGDSEVEIAAEKLAVVRDRSTLVIGDVSEEVAGIVRSLVAERKATLVRARSVPSPLAAALRGGFQRRNLGVAVSLVEAMGCDWDLGRSVGAIQGLELAGRLEVLPGEPPLVVDVAHNPSGAAALAAALPEVVGERRVTACLAVLEGKDAAGIVGALAPAVAGIVCTEVPASARAAGGRSAAKSLAADRLAACASEAGIGWLSIEADPEAAVELALARAAEAGGAALVSGSHYLSEYAWIARHAQS